MDADRGQILSIVLAWGIQPQWFFPTVSRPGTRSATERFEDRSPINTNWILGTFAKGTAQDAWDAIAAARAAFGLQGQKCSACSRVLDE